MEKDDYDQHQDDWFSKLERSLMDKYARERKEEVPLGPDKLAMEKTDGDKVINGLLNLFGEKEQWQLHKAVLECCVEFGGMENPVPLIAERVGKSQSQVYRTRAELRSLFKNFDHLYLEVKHRLTSKFTSKRLLVVWRDIMRGETPEAIRGKYGWDEARVDEAYATIWPIVDKVLNEILNR